MRATCSASASASTVSPRRARRASTARRCVGGAREAIERAFAGEDDPVGEPERDEYARACAEQVVTSLVAEVAEAAGETPLEFIELSGAVKGYADGRPTAPPAPSIAWQLGVDVDAVARACDGIEAIGYAADPERIRGDLEAYGDAAVSVIFRPTPPDCDSAENLRAKVDARPRARATARRLLPLRPHAAGRARLDTRRPDALSARPGSASVRRPSSTTTTPVHDHVRDPSGSRRGSS